jgi:hypothetical protein
MTVRELRQIAEEAGIIGEFNLFFACLTQSEDLPIEAMQFNALVEMHENALYATADQEIDRT